MEHNTLYSAPHKDLTVLLSFYRDDIKFSQDPPYTYSNSLNGMSL